MLSSLLTQFRQLYPQGSLTSDLVTIHDGLFVVRVCAGAAGTTLACGLGANSTLELAEDRATVRALEHLGLVVPDHPSAPVQPVVAPQPSPIALAPPTNGTASLSSGPGVPHLATPDPRSELARLELEREAALAIDLDDPELEPSPVALAIPPQSKAPALLPDPLAASPEEVSDDLINLSTGPMASIDLSDIIAQTDVELQRLGWGVHQGREFLEKTYGKRSRHDLTDEELLEFLLYLETQSPPGG